VILRTACVAVACFAAFGAHAEPFATFDQNPLLAGSGLPTPFAARFDSLAANSIGATLNWSSTAASQDNAFEALTLDVESREWTLSFAQALNDKIAFRLNLPYRSYSGGTLDNIIDEWHELGFDDGDRAKQPQDRLLIDYRRNSQTALHIEQSSAALGDLSADVGWQLNSTVTSASALWGTVKFPTGNAKRLTGNDAFGGSLTFAHERRLSSRWNASAQAGVTYVSGGDILPAQQTHWLWRSLLAFDYRYSKAISLTVQFDGHASQYDGSELKMMGSAWLLTVGGQYRWENWTAQFAIGEDIKVRASPDVDFILTVRRRWSL
jgi:hypothetical protein